MRESPVFEAVACFIRNVYSERCMLENSRQARRMRQTAEVKKNIPIHLQYKEKEEFVNLNLAERRA